MHQTNNGRWLIWLVLLMCVAGMSHIAVAGESASDRINRWIQEKEYVKAEGLLRQLVKRAAGDERKVRWHRVNLAKVQRLSGRPDAGLATLKRISEPQQSSVDVQLERGRCLRLTGKLDDAAVALRHPQGTKDKGVRAYARYELAEIAFAKKRYDPCIKLCKQVIDLISGMRERMRYEWELREYLSAARKLLHKAKLARIEERYGEDYAHYVRARYAEQRRDDKAAIESYSKIRVPILFDAAQCYTIACLRRLKQPEEAAALYNQHLISEKYGLYRGEAMYEQARRQLIEAQGSNESLSAVKNLGKVVEWCDQAQHNSESLDMSKLKAALKEFPPPKAIRKPDRLGNFHRTLVQPETVVNRMTTEWYLPRLKLKAMLLYAFGLNEKGDTERAIEVLQAAVALNAGAGGHLLNCNDLPNRLLGDAADGAFFFMPEMWHTFGSKYAVRLHLGLFLLVAGETGEAKALLSDVAEKAQHDRRGRNARAAAQLALACLSFESGNTSGSLKHLVANENIFTRTSSEPLAMIIQANILAGEKGQYQKAASLYEDVAKRFRRSGYAPRALLSWVISAANADHLDDAQRVAGLLTKQYEDSAYTRCARTMLDHLTTIQGASSNDSSVLSAGGSVVPIQRHLVIPGGGDLAIDLWQYASGDVLDYRVGYTVRAGCGLKNFRLRLTALEPQAPSTNDREIAFYRAPVLVHSGDNDAGR